MTERAGTTRFALGPLVNVWQTAPATVRGIVLMVVSTVGFAVMHAAIKLLAQELHPFQVAFARNAFGLIVFVPWILYGGLRIFHTQRIGLHLWRSSLNVVAMLCFFSALALAPLAEVTALSFTAPIFAGLMSIVLLGERFHIRRWTAVVIAFAGMLIILRPGLIEVSLGSVLVLISTVIWAGVMIIIKVLSRTESSVTITGYMNVMMTVLSLVPALFVWQPISLELLPLLVLVGVVGTLAQLALAQSLSETEPGVVMPFDFLKLIWTAALGYWLFAEVPDIYVWIGGGLIFSSSAYLAYRESQVRRLAARQAKIPPGPAMAEIRPKAGADT